MAQPTVSISAPAQGSSTGIPCTAAGNASPSPGNNIAGMAYQINGGPVTAFPAGSTLPPAAGGSWSFTLTVNDCPSVGNLFLLTVYVGDNSGNFNNASTNFRRSS